MSETCTAHDHPPCNFCDRPMRELRSLIADHPGTLAQRRPGICNSCDQAQKAGRAAANLGPKFVVGTPCTVCARPMRTSRTRLADAPGTVEGHNRFICRADKARYAKAGKPIPTEATAVTTQGEPTPATVTALDTYLAARRNRGIPPTGLRKSA